MRGMQTDRDMGAGSRALLIAAAIVIVIAGLKAAASIIVPVLLAGLVAVLCLPPMRFLQKRGLPDWVSLSLIFLVIIGAAVGFSALVGKEVADFRAEFPVYRERLEAEWSGTIEELAHRLGKDDAGALISGLKDNFDVDRVMDAMGAALGAMTDLVSQTLFVLLTVLFIVGEAAQFPRKLAEAFSGSLSGVSESRRAVQSIHNYVRVKTEVSLATGLLAFFLCIAAGVDSAVMWGLLAFFLNYVPTVGSLVAALPPVLLAFVQHGWQRAVVVAVGFLLINNVIGNVLEPRMMGRKLGLSGLVVFLSLVFWGFVWGPVGMFLSVPLTMLVKILLEQSDDLRWIAILLGPGGEDIGRATREDDGSDGLVFESQTVELADLDLGSTGGDGPPSS